MAYYAYKQVRDLLPQHIIDKQGPDYEGDGNYDGDQWNAAADYIVELKEALAAKDAELERCKRAVEWLKRHTSHLVYAHDNQMLNCIDGKLYAFGDSIADIIKPAAGGDGK